jgi:hypothetical protein
VALTAGVFNLSSLTRSRMQSTKTLTLVFTERLSFISVVSLMSSLMDGGLSIISWEVHVLENKALGRIFWCMKNQRKQAIRTIRNKEQHRFYSSPVVTSIVPRPNFVVEDLTLLLRILEVPDTNIGSETGNPDCYMPHTCYMPRPLFSNTLIWSPK